MERPAALTDSPPPASPSKIEEVHAAGQLALEVMHEIRQPLEALGHLVYLAEQEADYPDQVRHYMLLAGEHVQMLGDIANQTLSFTRPPQSRRAFNLVSLAEAGLRIHRKTLEAKMVKLVKDLPDEAIAEISSGEMLQVISNLIINALDAMPSGGTLCLRMRKRGDEVHLVIADNGHGIPREHVEKIFRPYFTTKHERGTGLGLAITKKIVEGHKGRIRLRSSERPGRNGTTFKIALPVLSSADFASR